MRYQLLPASFYVKNRKALMQKMQQDAFAIFFSNPVSLRNGDCSFAYRQDSDFFYLTGIDQAESILILNPSATDPLLKEILFIQEATEHSKIWDGALYTPAQATQTSGIQTVVFLDQWEQFLKKIALNNQALYLNFNENERAPISTSEPSKDYALKFKHNFPAHNILRAAPILSKLRVIKKNAELKCIQKACSITHKAFETVLKNTKPGKKEYEIEAEIIYRFIQEGANGHAYAPIVASGENACVLHYIDNNQVCKNGDLLLLDFGAEYANYAADLSRTIPVNGKFTKRQKEVYQACLNTFKFAKSILAPGILIADYQAEVGKFISNELIHIKLLTKQEVLKNPKAYQQYFMHGTSHFLGLDVHDVGDRNTILQKGMVLTCEPGIYIPKEKMGVRIENDILLTADGNKDLMSVIPIEIEEIEALMLG